MAPIRVVAMTLRDERSGIIRKWQVTKYGLNITRAAFYDILDSHSEEILEVECKYGVLDVEGHQIGDVDSWECGWHSYEIEDWDAVSQFIVSIFEKEGYCYTVEADAKTKCVTNLLQAIQTQMKNEENESKKVRGRLLDLE